MLFYSTSRNDIKLRNVRHKHLIAVAFNKLHTSAYGGHLGQQRTLHRFNERLFRPGLKELVARLVRECDTCQKVKDKPVQRAALVPIISTHPGQLVTTDITGPLTKTPRGHAYILAVIDHFTKLSSQFDFKIHTHSCFFLSSKTLRLMLMMWTRYCLSLFFPHKFTV